jgi:hypothetical protein
LTSRTGGGILRATFRTVPPPEGETDSPSTPFKDRSQGLENEKKT